MNIRNLVLVFAVLAPASALTAGKGEVRAACQADVKANCGTVFSRDKAMACLIEKAASLSDGCTAALKVASCNAKAPDNLKAAFPCAQ